MLGPLFLFFAFLSATLGIEPPTVWAASSAEVESESRTVIKIGVIAPLTGSAAARGNDVVRSAQIYTDSYNSRSSKYFVNLLVEDGRCGAGPAAATAANKLIRFDKVNFLLLGCSGEALQAGPIAQRLGVLTFVVLALHQDIKQLGDFIFRTYVDLEKGLPDFLDMLEARSGGRIALLSEENAFTEGIARLTRRQLGQAILLSDSFPADSVDYRALLVKVKGRRPNALFLNSFMPAALASLLTEVRRLGLTQPIYANILASDPHFLKPAGRLADGIVFFDTPSVDTELASYHEILVKHQQLYQEAPSFDYAVRTTHDALLSLLTAVEAVGLEPRAVQEYLRTFQGVGALGPLAYDEFGELKNQRFDFKIIENGQVKNFIWE